VGVVLNHMLVVVGDSRSCARRVHQHYDRYGFRAYYYHRLAVYYCY
jgi:hypothetical protein